MSFLDEIDKFENNIELKIQRKFREFDHCFQNFIFQKSNPNQNQKQHQKIENETLENSKMKSKKVLFKIQSENEIENENHKINTLSFGSNNEDGTNNKEMTIEKLIINSEIDEISNRYKALSLGRENKLKEDPEYHNKNIFKEIENSESLTNLILTNSVYQKKRKKKKINFDIKRKYKATNCFNQCSMKIDDKLNVFYTYINEENLIREEIKEKIRLSCKQKLKSSIKNIEKPDFINKSKEKDIKLTIYNNLNEKDVNIGTNKNMLNLSVKNRNSIETNKNSKYHNYVIELNKENLNKKKKKNKHSIEKENDDITNTYLLSNDETENIINLDKLNLNKNRKNSGKLENNKSKINFKEKIDEMVNKFYLYGFVKRDINLDKLREEENIKLKNPSLNMIPIYQNLNKNRFYTSSKLKENNIEKNKRNKEKIELVQDKLIKHANSIGINRNQILSFQKCKTHYSIRVQRTLKDYNY